MRPVEVELFTRPLDAQTWNAHMPTVCMPHHVVAASDPFQFPATLAKRLITADRTAYVRVTAARGSQRT